MTTTTCTEIQALQHIHGQAAAAYGQADRDALSRGEDPIEAHRSCVAAVVTETLQQARKISGTAFVDAFARSGAPIDPQLLGQELARLAAQAEGLFRQARTAIRNGTQDKLEFPFAAVDALLTLLAASTTALGLPATSTAREISDKCLAQGIDATTLRLHLLAVHRNPNALILTDWEAQQAHQKDHTNNGSGHSESDLSWDETQCHQVIAESFPDDDDRADREALNSRLNDTLTVVAAIAPLTAIAHVSGGPELW